MVSKNPNGSHVYKWIEKTMCPNTPITFCVPPVGLDTDFRSPRVVGIMHLHILSANPLDSDRPAQTPFPKGPKKSLPIESSTPALFDRQNKRPDDPKLNSTRSRMKKSRNTSRGIQEQTRTLSLTSNDEGKDPGTLLATSGYKVVGAKELPLSQTGAWWIWMTGVSIGPNKMRIHMFTNRLPPLLFCT